MKKPIALIAAFFIGIGQIVPCGYYPGDSHLTLFSKKNISEQALEVMVQLEPPISNDANIDAWLGYVDNGSILKEDVLNFIYYADEEEIEYIKNNLKKLDKSNSYYAENTLVKHWATTKNIEAFDYLIFAKKCIPHVDFSYEYYWDAPEKDFEAMGALLEEAQRAYKKTKDDFLKMRYGFQIVRMAHYMNEFNQAVQLFDEYVAPIADNSYMYYRALEQKAGALNAVHDGQAKSAHLFAKVFAQLPDRRHVCLTSFQLNNSTEWENALLLCKEKSTEEALYAMRGMHDMGNPSEEIQNIAAINPNSPFLDLLVQKSISTWERSGMDQYGENHLLPNTEYVEMDRVGRIRKIAAQLASNSSVERKDYWILVAVYADIFQGDYPAARKNLERIQKDSDYHDQAEIFDFMLQLVELKEVTAKEEAHFAQLFQENTVLKDNYHVKEFMFHSFYVYYNNQNDIAKAYLCHAEIPALRENLNLQLIDALLELVRKEKTTAMEELLIAKGATVLNKAELETVLLEMKGTYYMQRNQMKDAVRIFESCKNCDDVPFFHLPDYMNATLFSFSLSETDFRMPIKNQARMLYSGYNFLQGEMNKLQLAQNLLKLEEEAAKNPSKAGEIYLMLGSAWFNMSPIGWHRPVLYYDYDNLGVSRWEHGRKNADEETADIHRKSRKGWFWTFYYNPDITFGYLDKAVETIKDDNLKAEVLFLAARLEQYNFFHESDISDWDAYRNYYPVKNRKGYDTYFNQLTSKYSDTRYYKEVIKECSYLADYVK